MNIAHRHLLSFDRLTAPALRDVAIRVDAAVAQERPVAAHVLGAGGVAFGNHDFVLVVLAFRPDYAERVADERRAPELDAAVLRSLMPRTIDRRDVDAVGDRMSALDCL